MSDFPRRNRSASDSEVAIRKIFIGGLSYDTDDDNLKKYFATYGTIEDAVVMKDPVTKRSRGFGFITFSKISSVDATIADEPHTIDLRRVEVKRAVPKIEGSSTPTSSPSLTSKASPLISKKSPSIGPISSPTASPSLQGKKIPLSNLNNSLNSASNSSSKPGSASKQQTSMNTLQNRGVRSNSVVSNHSVNTDDGNSGSSFIHGSKYNSDEFASHKIFVGGLHYDTRDSDFKAYFEEYGKVLYGEVMFNRETHKSRGFGFIIFEDEKDVDKVCERSEHIIRGKVAEVKRAIPRSLLPPGGTTATSTSAPSSPSLGSPNPSPSLQTRSFSNSSSISTVPGSPPSLHSNALGTSIRNTISSPQSSTLSPMIDGSSKSISYASVLRTRQSDDDNDNLKSLGSYDMSSLQYNSLDLDDIQTRPVSLSFENFSLGPLDSNGMTTESNILNSNSNSNSKYSNESSMFSNNWFGGSNNSNYNSTGGISGFQQSQSLMDSDMLRSQDGMNSNSLSWASLVGRLPSPPLMQQQYFRQSQPDSMQSRSQQQPSSQYPNPMGLFPTSQYPQAYPPQFLQSSDRDIGPNEISSFQQQVQLQQHCQQQLQQLQQHQLHANFQHMQAMQMQQQTQQSFINNLMSSNPNSPAPLHTSTLSPNADYKKSIASADLSSELDEANIFQLRELRMDSPEFQPGNITRNRNSENGGQWNP